MLCNNCGKEVADNVQICDGCGSPVVPEQAGNLKASVQAKPANNEAQENKVIFMLAYLGILFFLPLVSAPNSKIGRFHANQGLVLLITGIVGQIILSILTTFAWRLWAFISLLYTVWGFVLFALMIIGMLNVNKGEQKPLPIIGQFKILK